MSDETRSDENQPCADSANSAKTKKIPPITHDGGTLDTLSSSPSWRLDRDEQEAETDYSIHAI